MGKKERVREIKRGTGEREKRREKQNERERAIHYIACQENFTKLGEKAREIVREGERKAREKERGRRERVNNTMRKRVREI